MRKHFLAKKPVLDHPSYSPDFALSDLQFEKYLVIYIAYEVFFEVLIQNNLQEGIFSHNWFIYHLA